MINGIIITHKKISVWKKSINKPTSISRKMCASLIKFSSRAESSNVEFTLQLKNVSSRSSAWISAFAALSKGVSGRARHFSEKWHLADIKYWTQDYSEVIFHDLLPPIKLHVFCLSSGFRFNAKDKLRIWKLSNFTLVFT